VWAGFRSLETPPSPKVQDQAVGVPFEASVNLTARNQYGSTTLVRASLVRVDPSRPLAAVPGGAGLPRDPDGDGRYEDVNGNGRADFADVVLSFDRMDWIAANEPVEAFDCNGNGRIDFADVVWLFNNL
jgi:PKD repeat protein